MKLDDEMRVAMETALGEIGHEATFLAGYRMGLERAAKMCEDMQWGADAGDCAAAIREMAQ